MLSLSPTYDNDQCSKSSGMFEVLELEGSALFTVHDEIPYA